MTYMLLPLYCITFRVGWQAFFEQGGALPIRPAPDSLPGAP